MKTLKGENKVVVAFIIFFIIVISPVLCFRYFVTVDGPAHLYNANVIKELLFGDVGFYSNYFEFNPVPVPNWAGHAFAVLAGFILPVWLTEKLIVLFILIGLPFSMHKMMNSFNVDIDWHFFLLLPFAFSILLYLGFFNFLIGLVIMFYFISVIIKNGNELPIFKLLVLSTILYFSHLMIFVLALLFSFIILIFNERKYFNNNTKFGNIIKLFVAFIPGFVLAYFYYMGRDLTGFKNTIDVLPISQLLQSIYEAAPIVGLNGEIESPYSKIFALGILVLFLITVFIRIKSKTGLLKPDVLLIMSFLLLSAYFTVPDGFASGGFISLRLLYMFYLFVVLWLACNKLPKLVAYGAALLSVFVCFAVLPYRYRTTRELSSAAENIEIVSAKWNSHQVVLPLNYSDNWLHTNLSNYFGANKQVLVLDNYEAVLNEFPLVWKKNKRPELYAGNFTQSLNPYITIPEFEDKTKTKINLVTRWQYQNSENDSTKAATDYNIKNLFNKIERVGGCDLFYDRK